MADAMLQKAHKSAATPEFSDGKSGKKSTDKASSTSTSSSGKNKSSTNVKQSQAPVVSTPEVNLKQFTAEMAAIMKELRENQTQLGEKVEKIAEKVETLSHETYGYEYEGVDTVEAPYDEFSNDNVDNMNIPSEAEDIENETASVPGIFKSLMDKYKHSESVDNEVNNDLASFVNECFRGGMPDEAYTNLAKDIHRPSNCTSLTKTTVNSQIWSYMKPWTQTADVKMQSIQSSVVKAAINLTKMMDKSSDSLDGQMLQWGSDALSILGHAHKLINFRRRESHQTDLDHRYKQLCSANVPFTDKLYGDDVCKNVKEIQDMSRVSKQLSVLSRSSRGGRRPRPYPGPYGGYRGRGRGRGGRYQQPMTNSYVQPTKNPRGGGATARDHRQ